MYQVFVLFWEPYKAVVRNACPDNIGQCIELVGNKRELFTPHGNHFCVFSFLLRVFKKIFKNFYCEYDRWVVETQCASSVVRKTRSLGALVLCSICNMVFVNNIYDIVADTQFHKFHGRQSTRVQHV